MASLKRRLVAVGAALGLSVSLAGCMGDYGYGGVGYASDYYYDGYGPSYAYAGGYGGYGGWYNDFYYPGYGVYVFDRGGRRTQWNDGQRRYWQAQRGRGQRWGDGRGFNRPGQGDGVRGDGQRRGWRGDGQRQGWRGDRQPGIAQPQGERGTFRGQPGMARPDRPAPSAGQWRGRGSSVGAPGGRSGWGGRGQGSGGGRGFGGRGGGQRPQ